jgi:hypothetical protein
VHRQPTAASSPKACFDVNKGFGGRRDRQLELWSKQRQRPLLVREAALPRSAAIPCSAGAGGQMVCGLAGWQ